MFPTETSKGKPIVLRVSSRDSLSVLEDDTIDDIALQPTKPDPVEKIALPSNRKVRFASKKKNIHYANPLSEDDYKNLCWLSPFEISTTIRETAQVLRDIEAEEKKSTSPFYWTKALVQIYKAFKAPAPCQKTLLNLMEGRLKIEDIHVGLEIRAIGAIHKDFQVQHKALLAKISYWQALPEVTPEEIADLICEACIEESRAPVAYAQYIAGYHAQHIEKEVKLAGFDTVQKDHKESRHSTWAQELISRRLF